MNKKELPEDIHNYYEIDIKDNNIFLKEKLCTDFEIKNIVQEKPDQVIFVKDDINERINNFLENEINKNLEDENYLTLKSILEQSNFFVKQIINNNKKIFLYFFNKHKRKQILKLKKELDFFENRINLLNSLNPLNHKKNVIPNEINITNLKQKNTEYYVLTMEYTKDHFDFVLAIKKVKVIPVKIRNTYKNNFEISYYLNENRRSEYTDLIAESEISSTGEVLLSDKMVFKTREQLEEYLYKWKNKIDKRFENTIKSLY